MSLVEVKNKSLMGDEYYRAFNSDNVPSTHFDRILR